MDKCKCPWIGAHACHEQITHTPKLRRRGVLVVFLLSSCYLCPLLQFAAFAAHGHQLLDQLQAPVVAAPHQGAIGRAQLQSLNEG